MDSIILSGGKGLRLNKDMAKALIKIGKKTLLQYQLDQVKDHVNKIILALGYKAEDIIEFCNKNFDSSIRNKLIFSIEKEPLGTCK